MVFSYVNANVSLIDSEYRGLTLSNSSKNVRPSLIGGASFDRSSQM
jgi:hypothetical protein